MRRRRSCTLVKVVIGKSSASFKEEKMEKRLVLMNFYEFWFEYEKANSKHLNET